MSGLTADGTDQRARNTGLFFKRWLANPLQMGSIIPSSRTLCRLFAEKVTRAEDEVVLELGAGTGVITRALLEKGVPAEKVVVMEIVPEMADHLREAMPGVNVICGDAFDLLRTLPERLHGKVGTVICGIPVVMLPLAEQRRLIDAMDAVAPGRGFLALTYCITSPLPYRKLGLKARREIWTPRNFPPASVWRYQPA